MNRYVGHIGDSNTAPFVGVCVAVLAESEDEARQKIEETVCEDYNIASYNDDVDYMTLYIDVDRMRIDIECVEEDIDEEDDEDV